MMTLRFTNTLTRKKEPFRPIAPPTVGMYTCGPTVYAPPHIGNLRTYIFADLVKRVLRFNGYNVRQVMNITDVGHLTGDADNGEEKMDQSARRERLSPADIALKYTTIFKDNLRALNIIEPDIWARATEHISDQISLIERLVASGHAYETAGAVYFDVSTFPSYGALTGQSLQSKLTGVRPDVKTDKEKRHPADFALWFKRIGHFANHLLHWPSPWGDGFPGWHIECSAMSMKYLGETIDIHTGGVDHILPHHSNEIAQSESATGRPFVRTWLHGEFLLIDQGRMGKSEGNALDLQALRRRGIPPLAYRFWLLQAHYRSKLTFSWEALEAARRGYFHLADEAVNLKRVSLGEINGPFLSRFTDSINNDLDIPAGLALLHELLGSSLPPSVKLATMLRFDEVLGLGLSELQMASIPPDVASLIRERDLARAKKDFILGDKLRKQIESTGTMIEDTPTGTVARRPIETRPE